MGTLALQLLRRGALQPRVADPVHAPRLGGVEASQVLELAARPGLEAPQTADDAQLDGRVVADVEVEMSQLLEGAPVPAVEHAGLVHVERAGDHLAPAAGEDHAQALAPAFPEEIEDAAVQI